MRFILVGLFGIGCLTSCAAYGQDSPSDQEALDKLRKHGIFVSRSDHGRIASTVFADADTLKTIPLLLHVKDLSGIAIALAGPECSAEYLKLIGDFPKLKVLELSADRLAKKDLESIAGFKQLEELSLDFSANTDEQIRDLRVLKDLKTLKRLTVSYQQASPKTLKDLQEALKHVKEVSLVKPDRIQLLKISPKDDQITNLQKEKFNAAASAINSLSATIREGKIVLSSHTLLGLGGALRNLKDAALDLSDRELKLKGANYYVDILGKVYEETEAMYAAGKIGPETLFEIRFYYLDAQLLQLRLKKELGAK